MDQLHPLLLLAAVIRLAEAFSEVLPAALAPAEVRVRKVDILYHELGDPSRFAIVSCLDPSIFLFVVVGPKWQHAAFTAQTDHWASLGVEFRIGFQTQLICISTSLPKSSDPLFFWGGVSLKFLFFP